MGTNVCAKINHRNDRCLLPTSTKEDWAAAENDNGGMVVMAAFKKQGVKRYLPSSHAANEQSS